MTARGGRRGALLALVGLFLLLVWPAILIGTHGDPAQDAYPTSEAADQHRYHYDVVRTMLAEWPHPDLVHYRSTTSPGYHLALALVAWIVGDGIVLLQLLSSLFALALLVVAWRQLASRAGPWEALAGTLPLLGSSYVLGAAIWLTTDDAALLFVALAVGGPVFGAATGAGLARSGLAATCAVGVRQIHLWSAAAGIAAALAEIRAGRPRRAIAAAPALLLPFALMTALFLAWGGLTPPAYAHIHDRGMNPAAISVLLGLVGIYGTFFLPVLLRDARELLPRDRPALLAIAGAVALTLVVPTDYDRAAGRWGGAIWELVRRGPVVADRSLVLPVLAAIAALVLLRGLARCDGRTRWVLGLSMLGFALAQCVNSQAWQRYAEPPTLLFLAWLAAAATPAAGESPRGRSVRWAGPALLGLLLLGLSLVQVFLPVFLWRPPPVG